MFCLFQFFANGTMLIKQVYMEDQGMYGCTANNSAGRTRTEAYVYIAGEWDFVLKYSTFLPKFCHYLFAPNTDCRYCMVRTASSRLSSQFMFLNKNSAYPCNPS